MIEYLGEIETKFENILAFYYRAQNVGSNHDKTEVKISWHAPFKWLLQGTTVSSQLVKVKGNGEGGMGSVHCSYWKILYSSFIFFIEYSF